MRRARQSIERWPALSSSKKDQANPAFDAFRCRSPAVLLAMLLGAATFNLFYSFLAGLLMFVGCYVDPEWRFARS
jgi:hypothetical protein